MLIVVIATAIRSAVTAAPVEFDQHEGAVMGIEDEEDDVLVKKRDGEESDEEADEVISQNQVDADNDIRRRGRRDNYRLIDALSPVSITRVDGPS